MNETAIVFLTFSALLGSALVAGTFFAFSTFVMRALSNLPAPCGIAAMQSINVVVINAWFMIPLFGTALVGITVVALAAMPFGHPGSAWLAWGAALYVLGTLGVTVAFNVPRNEALSRVDPHAPDAGEQWTRYLGVWTAWNHLRTASAAAATLCYAVAVAAL